MAMSGNWDFGAAFKFGFTALKKHWVFLLVVEVLFIIAEFCSGGASSLSSPILAEWCGILMIPHCIEMYEPGRRSAKMGHWRSWWATTFYSLVGFSGLLLCIVGVFLSGPLSSYAMAYYAEHREQGLFGALKAIWRRIFSDGQWKILLYFFVLDILISGLMDLFTLGALTPVVMYITAAWDAAVYCQAFPRASTQPTAAA